VRVEGKHEETRIEGYGALFNVTVDMWGWRERLDSGCCAKALKRSPFARCLWQHDASLVFGSLSNSTLSLIEDERGLAYSCIPVNAGWARDAIESIRRGDVTQSSFSFTVADDEWHTEDGVMTRTIHEIQCLYDVSPVTYPAYPDTVVGVRALLEAGNHEPERVLAMLEQVSGRRGLSLPREGVRQALAGLVAADEGVAADLDMLRRRLDLAAVDV
jgi:HK97 family phage prohead protease